MSTSYELSTVFFLVLWGVGVGGYVCRWGCWEEKGLLNVVVESIFILCSCIVTFPGPSPRQQQQQWWWDHPTQKSNHLSYKEKSHIWKFKMYYQVSQNYQYFLGIYPRLSDAKHLHQWLRRNLLLLVHTAYCLRPFAVMVDVYTIRLWKDLQIIAGDGAWRIQHNTWSWSPGFRIASCLRWEFQSWDKFGSRHLPSVHTKS